MQKQRARLGLAISMLTLAGAAAAATPGQNQKFIKQLYQDLLNRTPNRTELATCTSLLSFGAARTQIAGALTSSSEYRTDQIQHFFGAFLNRPATAGEVSFFLNYMQQGSTDDDVKAVILAGDEYYRLAGVTDHAFIEKLFEDVLGRPVDRSSEQVLQTLLGQGTTRQSIAGLVLHSLEADQREVTQLFQKLLNRLPQPTELTSFAQMLQVGAKDEFVVDLICGSDEYFQLAIK